jgi:ribosomal protein S18 acetylase RimI-like enzyme
LGRAGDLGFVAVNERGQAVGAVWLRLLKGAEKGFGYVDEQTPELGMAVLSEYRGQGIGTSLLARLIESAADVYAQLSLSVSAGNPARRLYQRLGFVEIEQSGDSITMKRRL